jgi:hypothetical protein
VLQEKERLATLEARLGELVAKIPEVRIVCSMSVMGTSLAAELQTRGAGFSPSLQGALDGKTPPAKFAPSVKAHLGLPVAVPGFKVNALNHVRRLSS